MCADSLKEEPHGVLRGCFDIIPASEPMEPRFRVEQDVRDPERGYNSRGYNCFSAIRRGDRRLNSLNVKTRPAVPMFPSFSSGSWMVAKALLSRPGSSPVRNIFSWSSLVCPFNYEAFTDDLTMVLNTPYLTQTEVRNGDSVSIARQPPGNKGARSVVNCLC